MGKEKEKEGGEESKGFWDYLHSFGESVETAVGLPKNAGEILPKLAAQRQVTAAERALEANTPLAEAAWAHGESGDIGPNRFDLQRGLVDRVDAAEKHLEHVEETSPEGYVEQGLDARAKLRTAQAEMPATPTTAKELEATDKAMQESLLEQVTASNEIDAAKGGFSKSAGFLQLPGVSMGMGFLGMLTSGAGLKEAKNAYQEGDYADMTADATSSILGFGAGGAELASGANAAIMLNRSFMGIEAGTGLASKISSISEAAGPLGTVAALAGADVAGNERVKDFGWFHDKEDPSKSISTYEKATQDVGSTFEGVDHLLGDSEAARAAMALPALLAAADDGLLEYGAGTALNLGIGVDALGGSGGLFGTAMNADAKGVHERGAFEALDDGGKALSNLVGGGWLGGGLRVLTDSVGAIPAFMGDIAGTAVGGAKSLAHGVGGLAADSGLFGTNDDGTNREAFGALDAAGSYLGNGVASGVDSLLGEGSTTGKVLGGVTHLATDAIGSVGAAVADVGGAAIGGVRDLWNWL